MAYCYAPDRKAERPIEHLKGFSGTLQVDGYSGYGALARRGDVQLAFCWAHVRRRFYELATQGTSPVAAEVLARIAALYKVEAGIRGASATERQQARADRSAPVVADLRRFLDANRSSV